MPGGLFDPDNPMSEMMIGILIVFANSELRLISQRTKEGLQARFDKVAVHDDKLVFISLVAFSQDVKAIRAALAAGINAPIWLRDVTLSKDGDPRFREPCRHRPVAAGSTPINSASGRSTPFSPAASRAS